LTLNFKPNDNIKFHCLFVPIFAETDNTYKVSFCMENFKLCKLQFWGEFKARRIYRIKNYAQKYIKQLSDYFCSMSVVKVKFSLWYIG
jgi:hypothetical protein